MKAKDITVGQWVSSGGLFALGATAAYLGAAHYGLGQLLHLGAGAFPFGLGILLMALSAAMLASAYVHSAVPSRQQWAGALAIFASIGVFAVLITTLGLVPAVFALVLISRLAEPPFEAGATLALAAGLSLLAYFVFIVGLRMPLEAFVWF